MYFSQGQSNIYIFQAREGGVIVNGNARRYNGKENLECDWYGLKVELHMSHISPNSG